MEIVCRECHSSGRLLPEHWRCACGGAWEPAERHDFDLGRIDSSETSVWRYQGLMGLEWKEPRARLNAGWTPLAPLDYGGRTVFFKLDYASPTSSFKDRGTEVMINILAHQGVGRVVDDSSGNAGASVAAYAARAGMTAEIYVTAHASPIKRAQIAVYGANVHAIPGPRANAQTAAWQAVGHGAVYASHAYHPGFLLGQQTAAWELWEQLGYRAPAWIVVPVGQGLNLLGYWLGFRRLHSAGLVSELPRLVAVQPTRLAPVWHALQRPEGSRSDAVPAIQPSRPSVAEGLAIAQPVRGRRLLQAIRETKGTCIIVEDDAILLAQRNLALKGLYVEPTSAASVAALEEVFALAGKDDTIAVPLTGSGLKGSPDLLENSGLALA